MKRQPYLDGTPAPSTPSRLVKNRQDSMRGGTGTLREQIFLEFNFADFGPIREIKFREI